MKSQYSYFSFNYKFAILRTVHVDNRHNLTLSPCLCLSVIWTLPPVLGLVHPHPST